MFMNEIENIENIIKEFVHLSNNELVLDNEKAIEYMSNNDIEKTSIVIVEKIIKLLNNNNKLIDLDISELIKKVSY